MHPLIATHAPGGFEEPLLFATFRGFAVAGYLLAQLLVVVYSSHRYAALGRWWRGRRAAPRAEPPQDWPVVTVQLPVYNERAVATRLIDAVAAFDYPRDRLEIQVLDDSTDDTVDRVRAAAARARARGVDVVVLHRDARLGFKAGALAAGLARARGDLVAVFDADFVPEPDFLRRMVPHLTDPAVGMAQARWAHLNRDRSALTAAQAVMLDAHFAIEHQGRMDHGLFFNFNGTAGVWRRACIEDAGGWMHDTLTEDLDLSYRAQLRGWRFVYDGSVAVPAELPAQVEALKSQQRRWAKGSIQTARKLLPGLMSGPLPPRIKIEALFHLTANVAYPMLLALGLLLFPVIVTTAPASAGTVAVLQAAVILLGVLPVTLFLYVGQGATGRPVRGRWRDVAVAMLLGIGLSVNNSRAVLEGLGTRVGAWERTPKSGDGAHGRGVLQYPAGRRLAGAAELGLATFFALVGWAAWQAGHPSALPFVALLVTGFGAVGALSLAQRGNVAKTSALARVPRGGIEGRL